MTEEAAGGEVVRVGEAMGGAAEHLEQVVGAVDSAAVSAVLDTELGIQVVRQPAMGCAAGWLVGAGGPVGVGRGALGGVSEEGAVVVGDAEVGEAHEVDGGGSGGDTPR